jgi:hypothetical protein
MSKKKEDGREKQVHKLLENLNKMLDKTSGVDKEKFLESLMGVDDDKEVINQQYYFYKRPKYKYGVVAEWLRPFVNIEDRDNKASLCGYVEEDCQTLPLSTIRRELRTYLYSLYANFDRNKKYLRWTFYGPLWLLERKQLTNCLDIVLEALRQDTYFFCTFIETHEDYFTAVLYQLGHEQVPVLAAFLREEGLVPMTKPIVFDALIWVVLNDARHRLEAVAAIIDYLNYCYDICMQGVPSINIDHYAFSLATAHVTEALPVLQKIYQDIDVPCIEVGDGIQSVEEIMRDENSVFLYEHDNLNSYLQELVYEKGVDAYGKMPYGDFEYNDEDGCDAYMSLVDTHFETEKYTLTVNLMGMPDKVERVLEVPSNIFLSHLAELILRAFGRKKWCDNCFVKDDLEYNSESNSDYWIFPEEQTTEYVTLAQLLNRKGDTLPFFVKISENKGWEHHIVLNQIGTYESEVTHFVSLVEGHGAYPPVTCKSRTQYKQLLKQGKLPKPNLTAARKSMASYEEDIPSEMM